MCLLGGVLKCGVTCEANAFTMRAGRALRAPNGQQDRFPLRTVSSPSPTD